MIQSVNIADSDTVYAERTYSWWPLCISKDVVKLVTSQVQMFNTIGGDLYLTQVYY